MKSEPWKCQKCGSSRFKEKSAKIPGSLGMLNIFEVTARICNTCGYIEFYEARK